MRRTLVVLLLLTGLLTTSTVQAQTSVILLSGGYQVGHYAAGLRNLDTWSLELNRAAATTEQAMHWTNTFHGLAFRAEFYTTNGLMFGLGFNNRHTIVEASYTERQTGVAMRTAFRPRLNELNLLVGYAGLGGRVRPGASLDFGIFTFDRRDAPAADFSGSAWHPFHNGDSGLFNSGRRVPTLGSTLFVEVAPFSARGAGFTLRPYYQLQGLIEASMFGRYGTLDPDSYDYFLSNFGVEANWAFGFK